MTSSPRSPAPTCRPGSGGFSGQGGDGFCYVESNEARGKIPGDLLADLEPTFRHVQETPHQVGGKRFEVQDTAMRIGHNLLFQVGSDTKLGWCWGDAGALYSSINPLNLALRRFRRVHGWLEGH